MRYLDENPRIVPLSKIDIGQTVALYASPIETTTRDVEPGEDAITELRCAQEAFEREMEISCQVATMKLKEINVATTDDPRTISNSKDYIRAWKAYKD